MIPYQQHEYLNATFICAHCVFIVTCTQIYSCAPINSFNEHGTNLQGLQLSSHYKHRKPKILCLSITNDHNILNQRLKFIKFQHKS